MDYRCNYTCNSVKYMYMYIHVCMHVGTDLEIMENTCIYVFIILHVHI